MSEAARLEQMLAEKAKIEDEAKDLDEEHRQLGLRAKLLTEKLIQELRKRNDSKKEAVKKLRSRVSELESQLSVLSAQQSGNKDGAIESTEMEEATEIVNEEPPEAIDDAVSVTEVAEEIEVGAGKNKRKRKFF